MYNNSSLSKETTLSTETVLSTEQLNSITNILLDESPKLPHPSTGSSLINDIGHSPSYLYRTPNLSIENTFRTESDTRINDIYLNSSKYEGKTPKRKTQILPKKLKYVNIIDNPIPVSIKSEEIPSDTDLEFLLLNSRKIDADKVQTVIEKFLKGGDHKTFFCFTETKVDSLDFTPIGIKIYAKHRDKKDKKGGGLMIGHKLSNRIKLEEMMVKNKDILALEGTIENQKYRIILSYFDSCKKNQEMNTQETEIYRKRWKN